MLKRLILAATLAAVPIVALAADISTKAAPALTAGYPVAGGWYYGLGTGGSSGTVSGDVAPGTRVVQGDLNAIVGYTRNFATDAFWFAEAQFGFANLNGSSNGLALSGPMIAIERIGVGSPLNAAFNPFGFLNASMPSLPLLPNGVTQSPGNAYAFAGLVEADLGASANGASTHQWVLAPLMGIGMLTRWSNNVVVDTWVGYQPKSQSVCLSRGGCVGTGDTVRVGLGFKY